MTAWLERNVPRRDEIDHVHDLASLTGLALALVNRVTKLGLLSRLAEQVTFVLMPPLILIFLVLGTIFWAWPRPPKAAPWVPWARW